MKYDQGVETLDNNITPKLFEFEFEKNNFVIHQTS